MKKYDLLISKDTKSNFSEWASALDASQLREVLLQDTLGLAKGEDSLPLLRDQASIAFLANSFGFDHFLLMGGALAIGFLTVTAAHLYKEQDIYFKDSAFEK